MDEKTSEPNEFCSDMFLNSYKGIIFADGNTMFYTNGTNPKKNVKTEIDAVYAKQ